MAAAIGECGFRDSTVADVVRHARTSRRTFYEYFASKQACFIALLQEANAAMVRQIAAAVDPRAPWDAPIKGTGRDHSAPGADSGGAGGTADRRASGLRPPRL